MQNRIKEARRLARVFNDLDEVAFIMGLTKSQVKKLIGNEKNDSLDQHRYTASTRRSVIAFYKQHNSMAQTAIEFELSASTVHRWLLEADIPIRNSRSVLSCRSGHFTKAFRVPKLGTLKLAA